MQIEKQYPHPVSERELPLRLYLALYCARQAPLLVQSRKRTLLVQLQVEPRPLEQDRAHPLAPHLARFQPAAPRRTPQGFTTLQNTPEPPSPATIASSTTVPRGNLASLRLGAGSEGETASGEADLDQPVVPERREEDTGERRTHAACACAASGSSSRC